MYDKKKYILNKINNYYKKKSAENKIKEKRINKHIKNREIDVIHIIYENLINRIYKTFKKHKLTFNITYTEIIGCNFEELEQHIKNQLSDNMTIANYGEWEVDHIIPVSSFVFETTDDIIKCFNYKNIQPLWKYENRKKSNKIQ